MEYRYAESGLDNVIIAGIDVLIDDAGEEVCSIPNINGLHKAIAHAIIAHAHGISGKELRFLRTEMGYTQDELADKLHVTRLSISRWERGEVQMDSQTEFMIRMLAAEKLHIDAQLSAEEIAKRCVWKAEVQQIKIDGTDPINYKPLAA
jgi:DNA-binding transcriptional regulator YiaG